MKIGQNLRLGAGLLIVLNVLMALGSIWILGRMTPAIQFILEQNEHSILACEEMLSVFAQQKSPTTYTPEEKHKFMQALQKAQENITEPEEPVILKEITLTFTQATGGDPVARSRTILAVLRLSQINRAAMERADKEAQQLGKAGAWGVVFMASILFLTGLLFLHSLRRTLIKALEEIYAVVLDLRQGNTLRRCTTTDLPKDIRLVFDELNLLLDDYLGFVSKRKPK